MNLPDAHQANEEWMLVYETSFFEEAQ